MSRKSCRGLLLAVLLILTGCGRDPAVPATDSTAVTAGETTAVTEATETIAIETASVTEPTHSPLYLPGVTTEDVIGYFHEVCLDAEFVNSGDPTRLQRWETPILYRWEGETPEDRQVLDAFAAWLNGVEGFPGIREAQPDEAANLRITFCGGDDYLEMMGDNFAGTDGGVTFWYNGADEIYDGIIGCRSELTSDLRRSVILEEVYNGLGPVHDTAIRPDSIIYSDFSTPQWLSPVDELILKLLYHPDMKCGMDQTQCEEIIRKLYY